MPKEVDHGFTGECYPDYFNLKARPIVKEQKPGQLSDEEIEQFFSKVNSNQCFEEYVETVKVKSGFRSHHYFFYNIV